MALCTISKTRESRSACRAWFKGCSCIGNSASLPLPHNTYILVFILVKEVIFDRNTRIYDACKQWQGLKCHRHHRVEKAWVPLGSLPRQKKQNKQKQNWLLKEENRALSVLILLHLGYMGYIWGWILWITSVQPLLVYRHSSTVRLNLTHHRKCRLNLCEAKGGRLLSRTQFWEYLSLTHVDPNLYLLQVAAWERIKDFSTGQCSSPLFRGSVYCGKFGIHSQL